VFSDDKVVLKHKASRSQIESVGLRPHSVGPAKVKKNEVPIFFGNECVGY